MVLYLVDEKVKSINTEDIIKVDIIKDKKHQNNFEIYITDNNGRYRFYSIAYDLCYKLKDCIYKIKENLINNFYIDEDKIEFIK
jgi:hypothetical protein